MALPFKLLAFIVVVVLANKKGENFDESIERHEAEEHECKLYMAKSTIKNAGLGMYTAISLNKTDTIGHPDLGFPIQDDPNSEIPFLIDDYVWTTNDVQMNNAGTEDIDAFVPGTGSIPNCILTMINSEQGSVTFDKAGLHPSVDPGADAITAYHKRTSKVFRRNVVGAGMELFVDYGHEWFQSRMDSIGIVPFSEDQPNIQEFLRNFYNLKSKYDATTTTTTTTIPDAFWDDIWKLITSKNAPHQPRATMALPKSVLDAYQAGSTPNGLDDQLIQKSTRSLSWLRENGKCMDHIRPDKSTIPQAGWGAFATRKIPRDGLVAPAPLVHIPDRNALTLYDQDDSNQRIPIGEQIIINYCFGHSNTTMILCSYGAVTNYINHDSHEPNVKVIWSDEHGGHQSSWLEQPVHAFDSEKAYLAMEYVALRDIEEGEEILIDYGIEWEEAWKKHVDEFEELPAAMSEDGILKGEGYDGDDDDILVNSLMNDEEDADHKWSEYFTTLCRSRTPSTELHLEGSVVWDELLDDVKYHPCDVLGHSINDDGNIEFSAEIRENDIDNDAVQSVEDEFFIQENSVNYHMDQIPRKAIVLKYREVWGAHRISKAFRHCMAIPDEIFPKAWKNK